MRHERSQRIFYDVSNDVGRRVIDASRFLDFWLFFNHYTFLCKANHLSKKPFIHLTENISGVKPKNS